MTSMHWNPAVGIPLIIIGLIVLASIWLFGQPRKPGQGKRLPASRKPSRHEPSLEGRDFAETTPDEELPAGGDTPHQGELDMGMREELERLGATLAGEREATAPVTPPSGAGASAAPQDSRASMPPSPVKHVSHLGRRPADQPVERIVSLFVVAREGFTFRGPDLVVAMEKAGLEFGSMNIFHRLLDGKSEQGAVFSVANMVKPGSFDMAAMSGLETPGLSFFMTLPGPLPALDAWDTMLPTAQRLAKLLEGLVLDEERNALGRQRIAHIRDELRGWDRRHEGTGTTFGA
ncbi:MAG TPA: cell division protein ZipA [Rhodanobacteraceae bacterium]|nr:cell division protein ZipA [Rhodanobacteraceae bacterium]